jgi:hypothetical protein
MSESEQLLTDFLAPGWSEVYHSAQLVAFPPNPEGNFHPFGNVGSA